MGPDLKGVTKRRSREWLSNYMSDPEKMLREGDPTAIELRDRYKGMEMPRPKLSDQELSDVLAYLRSKDTPLPPTKVQE